MDFGTAKTLFQAGVLKQAFICCNDLEHGWQVLFESSKKLDVPLFLESQRQSGVARNFITLEAATRQIARIGFKDCQLKGLSNPL